MSRQDNDTVSKGSSRLSWLFCNLCWKTAVAIFVCFIVIGAIGSIPIYSHYEKIQLNKLEDSGRMAIKTLFSALGENPTNAQIIGVSSQVLSNTNLKGAVITKNDGNLLAKFGEKPSFPMNNREGMGWFSTERTENGNRYDVAWDSQNLQLPFDVTARLDSRELSPLLNGFIIKLVVVVGGLSLLLSILVAFILHKAILSPILIARNNLIKASNDFHHPERYLLVSDRKDEIGDLFQKTNELLKHLGDGFKNIKAHEAILELRVEERTQELAQLANFDIITELPNLNLFLERLSQAIIQAETDKKNIAVIILELQDLRDIINVFGHTLGNLFLKQLGQFLGQELPSNNMLARVGPDQFGIMAIGLGSNTQTGDYVQWIMDLFLNPFTVGEHNILTTVNVGIAVYPFDANTAEELVQKANLALARAKAYILNSYQFYESGMTEKVGVRRSLLTDLHQAVDNNQLVVYYQPKIYLQKNQLTSMEALVRWIHPEKGLIPPGDFIPLAEESGLIIPIGEWVLRASCIQNKKWLDEGYPPLTVAVNLSTIQFKQKNIIDTVSRILNETRLPPEQLELEITESAIMDNIEDAISTMRALRGLGLSLSIDDFGTGYSSLSYLKRFPVQKIKIDQSFIRDLITEKQDEKHLAEIIIYLGHSLNLQVIAEGIDSEAKLNFLKVKGCDIGQGYLFGKPTEASKFPDFFKAFPGSKE